MTRKDIYVFKAKFGVGNFEIEVYKLPVKKETAKAYFVDDHYTYRKKVLKEEIGITKEEMIAVGDGFNDLSMIQYAGLGVAMANAQEIVRQNADYITLSNEEDGVAAVVEKFIL